MRGDHAGEMGSHSRTGDDHLYSFGFSVFCQLCGVIRIAMRAANVKVIFDPKIVQHQADGFAGVQIALTAEDDSNRRHLLTLDHCESCVDLVLICGFQEHL